MRTVTGGQRHGKTLDLLKTVSAQLGEAMAELTTLRSLCARQQERIGELEGDIFALCGMLFVRCPNDPDIDMVKRINDKHRRALSPRTEAENG